jgi:hypothetical protein
MATSINPASPSKNPVVLVVTCVFAAMVCGILFLTWKDIYSELPKFEQLQTAIANKFRADIAREVYSPQQYSIEFYDSAGKRYQLGGVEKPALDQIATALPTEVPVLIRYGRWRSAFPSAKIFTVYQLEIGNQVIIPYARLATASRREQSAGPLIILCTILVAGLAIFIGARRQAKFQRQLALLKSKTSNETRS